MSSRSYLSGSAKRKLKKQKDVAKKKNASRSLLENYLSAGSSNVKDQELPDDESEIDEPPMSNYCGEVLKEFENSGEPTDDITTAEKNEDFFSPDPAKWTFIDDKMIDYFINNPPPQNTDLLLETERIFGGVKRSLTISHFYHSKLNGEKLLRKWLVLSASTKMLFCWVCKLIHANKCNLLKGQLLIGFSDWKHASTRLKEHENSALHKQAMMEISLRSNASQRIDASLVQQYQEETKYWISVLQRVVAVIKFLSIRGLPFFGENETVGSRHNGNFMGCLEVIAEFDPLLSKHLARYGNPGRGNVSYLSSTCVNQFIEVMAKRVEKQIKDEIMLAKYYAIIIDSTPDITHLDQLCFVFRYVVDSEPVERFFKFIPMFSHKSEILAEIVLETLKEAEFDVLNCRGQSYDNASNMAGKYSGLQARLKSINSVADFVPCAAHSLNLVGVNAVESCSGAVQFFCLVQQLYTFFSLSTHRWQVLMEELKKSGDFFTLKNRSGTRWCADAEAVKSLRKSYSTILLTLTRLSTDDNENAGTKLEAQVLKKKFDKLETVLNIIIWDTLLQRLHQTSMELQKSSINLTRVTVLYQSLIDFTQYVRDNFEEFEKLARVICQADFESTRKKVKPKSKDPHALNSSEVYLAPRESFKSNNHFAICDALIVHLTLRKDPYDNILKKFACFMDIKEKSTLRDKAINLQKFYPHDLEDSFADELLQFSSLVEDENSIADMLKKLKSLDLEETFPNVDSALRIFLTLPASNCSGERSFSLLKRLKSPVRASITQEKLSALAILCIEGEVTQKLDFIDVIDDFVKMKSRKKSELLNSKTIV